MIRIYGRIFVSGKTRRASTSFSSDWAEFLIDFFYTNTSIISVLSVGFSQGHEDWERGGCQPLHVSLLHRFSRTFTAHSETCIIHNYLPQDALSSCARASGFGVLMQSETTVTRGRSTGRLTTSLPNKLLQRIERPEPARCKDLPLANLFDALDSTGTRHGGSAHGQK